MKRKIAIGVGVVLFVIAIAFFADSLPYSRPKSDIDASKLTPTRIEIPAVSNGYSLLLQARKLLAISENEPILMNFTNWDETKAREILVRNKAAISTMHKAWSCPFLQGEAITNAYQESDYLEDWTRLAELAVVEARLSFNNGNESQGYAQAVDVIRFGQRLQEADGNYIHYLFGASIKSHGLYCVRQFADRTTLSASNLVLISEELTNFEANQAALRQMLKIEYTAQANTFDDMAVMPHVPFYFKIIYNADKSKRDLAGQVFCTMLALTNCYAKGITFIPLVKTNKSFVARLAGGNMMGTLINDMALEAQSGILMVKCRENINVRATRTILALRAYEMINHLPARSLQMLTPNFLEAIPLDDFDGKPMRYSPSLKKVYSVGVDLIDSGGVQGTNSTTGDIVFPFNF